MDRRTGLYGFISWVRDRCSGCQFIHFTFAFSLHALCLGVAFASVGKAVVELDYIHICIYLSKSNEKTSQPKDIFILMGSGLD